MSGFDWNAFLATLLATIVGAAVAAFIGLYVARLEKPQSYFRVDSEIPPEWVTWERDAVARVVLSNVGDGPAYDVSFNVAGSRTAVDTVRAAKLDSGAALSIPVTLRMTGREHMHPETLAMSDNRRVHWPEQGVLASIRWQQPPRRRHARLLSLPAENPFAGTKWDGASRADS